MLDTLRRRFERLPLLDRIFDISVTLKGIDGLLELVGGVLLLVLSPVRLNAIVRFLTQHVATAHRRPLWWDACASE